MYSTLILFWWTIRKKSRESEVYYLVWGSTDLEVVGLITLKGVKRIPEMCILIVTCNSLKCLHAPENATFRQGLLYTAIINCLMLGPVRYHITLHSKNLPTQCVIT